MEEASQKLRKLGYDFNKNGVLLQVSEKGKLCSDIQYELNDNEEEFAALADAVNDYIGASLEKKGWLKETLPGGSGNAKAFIYVTPNFLGADKLLILIQDASEYLRAGTWSMETILTEGISTGSMIPLSDRARKGCLACAIFNPNMNFVDGKGGEKVPIPGSETPIDHGHLAFAHLARNCKATNIVIIGHRFGGTVAVELSGTFQRDFNKRVKSVQLVDSDHDPVLNYVGMRLQEISVNYIASKQAANRGIVKKDKLTRQINRLGEARDGTVFKLSGLLKDDDDDDGDDDGGDDDDQALIEMRATGNFADYDYGDDPIFLDIPLVSAGKNLPRNWTPQILENHLFARIDECLVIQELAKEREK